MTNLTPVCIVCLDPGDGTICDGCTRWINDCLPSASPDIDEGEAWSIAAQMVAADIRAERRNITA